MKLTWLLLLIVGLVALADLSVAAPRSISEVQVDPWGQVFRSSRMSEYEEDLDDGDDDDDEDDDDDDDQDDDTGIYPPDFAKLFPNPDGRPVGPESYGHYGGNHPASFQYGRPSHGPASSVGPAAMRGPVQAQQGQKQGGIYRGTPSRDAPPPSYGPGRRPLRRYRTSIEDEDEEYNVPEGRGLPVTYRVISSPYVYKQPVYYYGKHNVPVVPQSYYTTVRRVDVPNYVPVVYGRIHGRYTHVPYISRIPKIYNPWSSYQALNDPYNPQMIYNPTEMRARRVFRYHPSQRVPAQRIPIYSGVWGNPRDHFITSHGKMYGY